MSPDQVYAQHFAHEICKLLNIKLTTRLHTAGVTGSIPVPPTRILRNAGPLCAVKHKVAPRPLIALFHDRTHFVLSGLLK